MVLGVGLKEAASMEGSKENMRITRKELGIFHELIVISSLLLGMSAGFLIASVLVDYPESRFFSILFGIFFIPATILQFFAISRNSKYGKKYRELKRALD